MSKELDISETFIFMVDSSYGKVTVSCIALDKAKAIEKFKNEFEYLFNHNWKVMKVDQFID